jgi:hypothetical protein
MRGHNERRVGAHRKYLAADLEPLERFPNRCIRFVRVVRRFSAAFVAAKRPQLHQLWNCASVPTQVLDKTALAFCASLYRKASLASTPLSRTQNDRSRQNQIARDE